MTQAYTAGWTPEEIRVLDHATVWRNSAVIRPHRFGRSHEATAQRLLAEELAAAGLTVADFEAYVADGPRPGRSGGAEPEPGRQRVTLPTAYDDVRDRGKLIAKLSTRIPGDPQVETITHSDGTVAAVVVQGTPSWRPLAETRAIPPDVRDTDAAKVDSHLRGSGHTLLAWDHAGGRMLVGTLAPVELGLRDRIADYLSCRPSQVRISSTWGVEDGAGVLQAVHVHGYPVIADPLVRRKRWSGLIADILPITPGASWRLDDNPAAGGLVLTRAGDPLADGFSLADFEATYRGGHNDPETSWAGFPVARREDGTAVSYTTFHTLIVGQTGAGKGSVLWSILSGLLPSARAGLVEFVAIDPKNAEAKDQSLFSEVATTPDAWAELLVRLVDDLKARQARSGRSFQISRETPLRILMIDELSALSVLDSDPKRRAEVDANLMILLSQGRSDGNIVIAAVQAPQKDLVGRARMFYAMRVALRTETPTETDLVLGQGSVDQGALAHLITPANPGNHYASAGVAYMRLEGEADPVRVRFPFTDDETLARWSAEFGALRATQAPTPQVVELEEMEFTLEDEDEDEDDTTPASDAPEVSAAPADDDGWAD